MSETSLALQLGLDYAYQNGLGVQGYARTLEDAMQECQGVATGPLHWASLGDQWVARDAETGEFYRIEQLPF